MLNITESHEAIIKFQARSAESSENIKKSQIHRPSFGVLWLTVNITRHVVSVLMIVCCDYALFKMPPSLSTLLLPWSDRFLVRENVRLQLEECLRLIEGWRFHGRNHWNRKMLMSFTASGLNWKREKMAKSHWKSIGVFRIFSLTFVHNLRHIRSPLEGKFSFPTSMLFLLKTHSRFTLLRILQQQFQHPQHIFPLVMQFLFVFFCSQPFLHVFVFFSDEKHNSRMTILIKQLT